MMSYHRRGRLLGNQLKLRTQLHANELWLQQVKYLLLILKVWAGRIAKAVALPPIGLSK